eukprot:3936156-Rhodomonas_salina.1
MVPASVQGVNLVDLRQGYVPGAGLATAASFVGYRNSGQVSVIGYTPVVFPPSVELSVSFSAYLYNVVDESDMFFFRVGRIIGGVLFDGVQMGLHQVGNAVALEAHCQVISGGIEIVSLKSIFPVALQTWRRYVVVL